jgi:hypothetical protein
MQMWKAVAALVGETGMRTHVNWLAYGKTPPLMLALPKLELVQELLHLGADATKLNFVHVFKSFSSK